jgi:hypothetical protein
METPVKTSTDYLRDVPSAAQYKAALLAIRDLITKNQRKMLRAHFHAPRRTITATKMAKTVQYRRYSAANLQYGILGRHLCEQLSRRLEFYIAILADFDEGNTSDPEIHWIMLPQVAQALSDLRWV